MSSQDLGKTHFNSSADMKSPNSTSLQDYISEQKTKGSTRSLSSFLPTSPSDYFSKLSKGLASVPLLGRSETGDDSTDDVPMDPSNNRKNGNGWFSGETAFGLNRFQRILAFFFCLIAGLLCFGLAIMYIPVLVFKARKFAALYTLGTCFFLFSFALLWGPYNYVSHLCSAPRLPVTVTYFFSLFATLYCSLWVQSTVLTIICAVVQGMALLWFLVSYVPGGDKGLKFMGGLFGKLIKRSASSSKNILPI